MPIPATNSTTTVTTGYVEKQFVVTTPFKADGTAAPSSCRITYAGVDEAGKRSGMECSIVIPNLDAVVMADPELAQAVQTMRTKLAAYAKSKGVLS